MKHAFIVLAVITTGVFLVACHSGTDRPQSEQGQNLLNTDSFSRFIPVDTANIMLTSYLSSINYLHNDTDIQSLIVDVRQLRKYIDSMPESSAITHIKLMFAHTVAYANSTNSGSRDGYNSKALTIIIAAYDGSGNYVLYPGNMVLDYTQPCPPICPPGNASSPLLPTNTLQHK